MLHAVMHMSPKPMHGQRRDSRLRLALPARLVTLGGYSTVRLCDLSQSGARVRLHDDGELKSGSQGMLSWLGHEAFGQVVWSRYGHAGLEFDELLPPDILLDTREKVDQGVAISEEQAALLHARAWYEAQR